MLTYPYNHQLRLAGADEAVRLLNQIIDQLEKANSLIEELASKKVYLELMTDSVGKSPDEQSSILP